MYFGLHWNCRRYFFFFAILTRFGFSRQIFIKISNVNFDEKSSNESRADTCRETDGRTDRPYEANRPFSRLTRTRLKISTRQKIYEWLNTRTEAPSVLNIPVSCQLVMLFNTLRSQFCWCCCCCCCRRRRCCCCCFCCCWSSQMHACYIILLL